MTPSDEQQARIDRETGRRASHELSLTNEAFSRLRSACVEELINLPAKETEQIQHLRATLQILDAVKNALHIYIDQGEAADRLIQHYILKSESEG